MLSTRFSHLSRFMGMHTTTRCWPLTVSALDPTAPGLQQQMPQITKDAVPRLVLCNLYVTDSREETVGMCKYYNPTLITVLRVLSILDPTE